MNPSSDTKRLANAVAGIAATITKLIDARVQKLGEAMEQRATMHTFEPMLTRKQLAEHFQVSLRSIENWTRDGRLPHIKISSASRYLLSEVLAHIRQNEWVRSSGRIRRR